MAKRLAAKRPRVPVAQKQSGLTTDEVKFLEGVSSSIRAVSQKENGSTAGSFLGQVLSALSTLGHDCGVVGQVCGTLDMARDLIPKRRNEDREALRVASRDIKKRFCPGHCS